MKPIISILTVVFASLILMGCKSKETRVLDDLDRLTERIEKEGSKYDFEDWTEALDDLKLIQEDASYCDFTPRQAEEYGRKMARLQAVVIKNGAVTVKDALENFYSPFFKGMLEGWEEEIEKIPEDTDLIENEEELTKELEELSKEAEKIMQNLDIPSEN